jgi:hypothetical protein
VNEFGMLFQLVFTVATLSAIVVLVRLVADRGCRSGRWARSVTDAPQLAARRPGRGTPSLELRRGLRLIRVGSRVPEIQGLRDHPV